MNVPLADLIGVSVLGRENDVVDNLLAIAHFDARIENLRPHRHVQKPPRIRCDFSLFQDGAWQIAVSGTFPILGDYEAIVMQPGRERNVNDAFARAKIAGQKYVYVLDILTFDDLGQGVVPNGEARTHQIIRHPNAREEADSSEKVVHGKVFGNAGAAPLVQTIERRIA